MTAGLQSVDLVTRRAMFALELIDPGRGLSVGSAMNVAAANLGAPNITRAGQFVWNDFDPPADRDVEIKASSADGWFATWSATVHVPARAQGVPIHVERVVLQPTGLYEPPAGMLAAAGMVIDNKQSGQPLAGIKVQLQLRSSIDGSTVPSSLIATSDIRGGFVAMAGDPGAAAPAPDGTFFGWLSLSSAQGVRYSAKLVPLRQARLLRVAQPFYFDTLSTTAPT